MITVSPIFMERAVKFLSETYPETDWTDASMALTMAAFGQVQHAVGGNYTANDGTFPTEIVFANGRKVGIAFDGDKPYLTVGKEQRHDD